MCSSDWVTAIRDPKEAKLTSNSTRKRNGSTYMTLAIIDSKLFDMRNLSGTNWAADRPMVIGTFTTTFKPNVVLILNGYCMKRMSPLKSHAFIIGAIIVLCHGPLHTEALAASDEAVTRTYDTVPGTVEASPGTV